MKKSILYLLLINLLCCGHEQSALNEDFGCSDYMDFMYDIYQFKKTPVQCKSWKGKTIQSDIELEELFKSNPECEAISFKNSSYSEEKVNVSKVISKFKKLKYLDIDLSKFDIPFEEVEKLQGLLEININALFLDSLEIDFGSFPDLKRLTIINGTSLIKRPKGIEKCINLEYLVLHNTMSVDSEELDGIEKLPNLIDLHIGYPIYGLSYGTVKFSRIKRLSISQSFRVHESIFNLSELEYLNLMVISGSINFTKISNLKSLKFLNLDKIVEFEGTINLPDLKTLIISQYRNENLILDLKFAPKLKELIIENTFSLKSITLKNIGHLEKLEIRGNSNLNELIVDKAEIKKIDKVHFSYNENLDFKQ